MRHSGLDLHLENARVPSRQQGCRRCQRYYLKIGSFGPAEDQFFFLVTQYARDLGLPRIYLSANSGAHIGLAEEAIPLFSAAWNDDARPKKGVNYLYLTPENNLKLKEKDPDSVRIVEIEENGERCFKITDVIGLQDGLGVECLKGSGLIAGETSRAYDNIFTITLVTARLVGIGAYLVLGITVQPS